MESLYILVPLSVLVVLAVLGLFRWALQEGQFDELNDEGRRILDGDASPLDIDQDPSVSPRQESWPSA